MKGQAQPVNVNALDAAHQEQAHLRKSSMVSGRALRALAELSAASEDVLESRWVVSGGALRLRWCWATREDETTTIESAAA